MKPLAALLLAAGCATAAPTPATSPVSAPAPAPAEKKGPRIELVQVTPAPGATIDASTTIRLGVEYAIDHFQLARDRIAVVFKTSGGRTWEPTRYVLVKAHGKVTFEIAGADLVQQGELVHPIQLLVALDSWEAPEKYRSVAATPLVTFHEKGNGKVGKTTKFLAPGNGISQLLVDIRNDARFRPRVPPELHGVFWGLFKVCVDTDGGVYDVQQLKSAHPTVDPHWQALALTWKHKPYLIQGEAVPYCYPMRLEVRN
jgi:hypothetical protein